MNQTVPQLKTNPSNKYGDYGVDAEQDNKDRHTDYGNGNYFTVVSIHNNKR